VDLPQRWSALAMEIEKNTGTGWAAGQRILFFLAALP
jgi:hypothetical protein